MKDLTKNLEGVFTEEGISKKGSKYVILHVVFKQGYDYKAFASEEQRFILENLPADEVEKA